MFGKKKVGLVEPVTLIGPNEKIVVLGKFDTGAQRTSIDESIFKKLNLKKTGEIKVHNVHGTTVRPLTEVRAVIGGKKLVIDANVADRSKRKFRVLIGRNTIYNNFIVDITKSHNSPKVIDLNESLRNRRKK